MRLGAACLTLLVATSAQAATLTVTTSADSGVGSLRAAIASAGAGDTIVFDASLAGGTINLNSALSPAVSLTIDGSAAPGLSLVAGSSSAFVISTGGINVTIGTLSLSGTDGSGNGGGAVHIETSGGTTVTVNDSTISGSSTGVGGAFFVNDSDTLVVNRSTVSGSGGNAIQNGGGCIGAFGNLTLTNSTLTNCILPNGANGGAIVMAGATVTITNCTIANNTAGGGAGGGIWISDSIASGTLTMVNTIVAGNTSASGADDITRSGNKATLNISNSLVQTTSVVTNGVNGNIVGSDPQLGGLGNHGGPTLTMEPVQGSPALDAGSTASCPATDQRGIGRPNGSGCDIGAYEAVVGPALTMSFAGATLPYNSTTPLTFTLTNTNATTTLTGIGFANGLPSTMIVATPNGLTGSCGGGTILATAGGTDIELSGATLAAGATCTFSVDVLTNNIGTQTDTTSLVSSNEADFLSAAASQTVDSVVPPSIGLFPDASTILLGGTTTLTINVVNSGANDVSLTNVGFTAALPPGLVVAGNVSSDCGGNGTFTAVMGSSSLALSGVTLTIGQSCDWFVDVQGTSGGLKEITTGDITADGGLDGGTATVDLSVCFISSGTCQFCSSDKQCSGNTPHCDVPSGTCAPCGSDGDCSGGTPACLSSGACGQCSATNASQCTMAKPVCIAATNFCGCGSDSDCGDSTSGLVCTGSPGLCVAGCAIASGRNDCPSNEYCSDRTGKVGACISQSCGSDSDCTTAPQTKCDANVFPHVCVQCVADGDCGTGLVCDVTNTCVECTTGKTDACTTSGAGASCLPTSTCGCVQDSDCGDVSSGRICDGATSTCKAGCRGSSGNGCPFGEACSSTTANAGTCGTSPDAGTNTGKNGGSANNGCAVGGHGDAGATGLLFVLLFGLARSRRRRAA